MKNTFFLLSLVVLLFQPVLGQYNDTKPTGKVWVLHEGTPTVKGTIAILDYQANTFKTIDSIASYGNCLIAHNGQVFATDGGGAIHVYDQTNTKKIKSIPCPGVRNIAISGNEIVATCTAPPFFRVLKLDGQNSLVFALDTTKAPSEADGLIVLGRKAWFVCNGFNGFGRYKRSDSILVVVDLDKKDTLATRKTANNPVNLTLKENKVFVHCQDNNGRGAGGPGLIFALFNPTTFEFIKNDTVFVDVDPGFSASERFIFLNANKMNPYQNTHLLRYNPKTERVDTVVAGSFYGLSAIADNAVIVSESTFGAKGKVRWIINGTPTEPITVGDSPRAMLWEPAKTTARDLTYSNVRLNAYPNPVGESLTILGENLVAIKVVSAIGQVVFNQQFNSTLTPVNLDTNNWPSGIYIVTATSLTGDSMHVKVLKP